MMAYDDGDLTTTTITTTTQTSLAVAPTTPTQTPLLDHPFQTTPFLDHPYPNPFSESLSRNHLNSFSFFSFILSGSQTQKYFP